jgi:hypothetical protein
MEDFKISELKKQLAEEIQKENSDNTIILALSNELSKLDKDNIRFSVDAGIINRLGKELVGRHETAVSELVKNAYDADAITVELLFTNAWDEGGTLQILDNGVGMDRDQLINGTKFTIQFHRVTKEHELEKKALVDLQLNDLVTSLPLSLKL